MTAERVLEIVHAEVPACREVTLETKLDDTGMDSLDFLFLVGQLEVEFNIKSIPTEQYLKWNTVGDIASWIESLN